MKEMSVFGRQILMIWAVVFCSFVFSTTSHAKPVYLNNYLMQGEAIGSVLNISPSVQVQSEHTVVDVRGWVPSLQEPLLHAMTTYDVSIDASESFSLFSLNSSREPIITLNDERILPSIAQYPLSKMFYENSFRAIDTRGTPIGALLKKSR